VNKPDQQIGMSYRSAGRLVKITKGNVLFVRRQFVASLHP